jgi:hypothetical protein
MMFKYSLIAALAATLAPISALAAAVDQVPIGTMSSWSWQDCGEISHLYSYRVARAIYMLRFLQKGLPTDAIQVQSISISPDPPVPGQDLSVTAVGTARETIEVCLRSQLFFFSEGADILCGAVGGRVCRCYSEAWPHQALAEDVRCV